MILRNFINAGPDRQSIADRAALSRAIFDALDRAGLDSLIGRTTEHRALKPKTHRLAIDGESEMREKIILW